jgi:hypothetical protein
VGKREEKQRENVEEEKSRINRKRKKQLERNQKT